MDSTINGAGGKSRVKINILPDNEKKAKEKGLKTSAFLLTVNPNVQYQDPNVPEARALALDLADMADYILKKSIIKSILYFEDVEGKPTKSLEEHKAAIEHIDDDRTASVEYGGTSRRMHVHIFFTLKHRTRVKIDRSRVAKIATEFLGVPASQINISFLVGGASPFLDYVKKYNKINEQYHDEINKLNK
jgi:hypothetical protein